MNFLLKKELIIFRKVIRTYSIRFLEKMRLIKNNDYVIKPYPGKVILIKGKGSRMGFGLEILRWDGQAM